MTSLENFKLFEPFGWVTCIQEKKKKISIENAKVLQENGEWKTPWMEETLAGDTFMPVLERR